jgi:hypothetical protein
MTMSSTGYKRRRNASTPKVRAKGSRSCNEGNVRRSREWTK